MKERLHYFRSIWSTLAFLERSKIKVTMVWCPGHCDIVYNDLADEEAKKAAEELSNANEVNSVMQSVSINTVKKIITGMQQRDWQLSWDRSTTGERTRELIPSVKDRLHWRGIRTADMAYARMLLGRTNLNENMFKMKFVESPDCECGEAREDINHFLLECPVYKTQREVMTKRIAEVWMENRRAGNLSVTAELLLAPKFSPKLNAKEDLAIKDALFQYLLSSEKVI